MQRKTFCWIGLLAAAHLWPGCALAQSPESAAKLQRQYTLSGQRYEAGHFEEAAAALQPIYAAGPDGFGRDWYVAMYDLACDEARSGHPEKAMEVLEASQSNGGSTSAEHLATDSDLVTLHGNARFAKLVEQARGRDRLWQQEPGQNLPYMANLGEDARIAGLSTFWSEARLNFAFFERQPALDWNQLYLEYLPRVRAAHSTEEYYRVLMHFAAELKDGHTNVYPPEALTEDFYARPGLSTRLIGKDVVVTSVASPELKAQGWQVGDQIRTLDREDIHTYAEREVAPLQSASTPQDLALRTYGSGLLRGKADSLVIVGVVDRDGHSSDRTLVRLSTAMQSKLPHPPGVSFALRPDRIAVLTINQFEDTSGVKLLLAHLSEINAARGLILDVRSNGGGSTPVDLLRILATSPIRGAMQKTRSYQAVERARGMLPGWAELPVDSFPVDGQHHVTVPVAVLTSAGTFSAAEDFVAAFHAMHRGITVGELTGGSTGQPFSFKLPGGGSARVCTKNDRAGDGTVFEGIGLKPDVEVRPTLADIRAGGDPVMQRAASLIVGQH